MSNFFYMFILSLFYLVPLSLIILGVLLRKKHCGIVLFMIGSIWLSNYLIEPISNFLATLICKFLYVLGIDAVFRDTFILSFPLFIASIFGSYKLFDTIYTWKARKYIAIAKKFISQNQSSAFPSCEKIIIEAIKEKIIHSQSSDNPNDLIKTTEILVYNTALELICTNNYHLPTTGGLSPTGESLLYLCSNCLDIFLKMGYISSEKYSSECEFLKECKYHDFFNGPQPY